MMFLVKDNGNEGLFDPKENRDPKLKLVDRSLTILIVTGIALAIPLFFVLGIWWTLGVLMVLFANNYNMYHAAYRDGFRGGYQTAMDDHDDLGFIPERIRDHA